MAVVTPADFRTETQQAWTKALTLDESLTDDYLEGVIAQIVEELENELGDTFEAPSPDDDITLDVDSWGGTRLYVSRRIRSITTVSTRSAAGALTIEAPTSYRVTSSVDGDEPSGKPIDCVDLVQPLSIGSCWPWAPQGVELVGKFGWESPPAGVKRLVSLLVYDYIKANPAQRRVQAFETRDVRYTPIPETGDSSGIAEVDRLKARYRRYEVLIG